MPIENQEQFEKLRANLKAGQYAGDQELQTELIKEAQAWKSKNLFAQSGIGFPITGRPDPEGPVSEGPTGLAEGFGSGLTDLALGTRQVVAPLSMVPGLGGQNAVAENLAKQAAEKRETDAPLLATAPGVLGSIGANLAATLPFSALSGVNTLRGATALGAGLGAVQPTETGQERAINTAGGAAFGLGGQGVGSFIARNAASRLAARQGARETNRIARQPINELIEEATVAGYVIPPSTANPSGTNRFIEGFAGKTRVAQSASIANQQNSNRLAKEALDMPANVPLSKSTVQNVRRDAGRVYDDIRGTGRITADARYRQALNDVRGIPNEVQADFPDLRVSGAKEINELIEGLNSPEFSASSAIQLSKQLRKDASVLFRAADDPAKLALARSNRAAADAMDDLIERHLLKDGPTQLAARYQAARPLIAKSHTVEDALNEAGMIDPRNIARQLNKGVPLTDELSMIGRFSDAFPQASKTTTQSFPSISPLDTAFFAGGGGLSVASGGAGSAVAAIPLLRMLTTRGLLGNRGQQSLLTQSPFEGTVGDTGLSLLDIIGQRGGVLAASGSQ